MAQVDRAQAKIHNLIWKRGWITTPTPHLYKIDLSEAKETPVAPRATADACSDTDAKTTVKYLAKLY
jgi:hypothetical protein